MTDPYRCQRAVYLHGLPLEHVEEALKKVAPYTGRKKRIHLGVSDEADGWRLVGVAEEVPDVVFLELAWALFGGDDAEDFDLEKLAVETDVPDDAVVAVHYGPGEDQRWYALVEPNDRFDVLFAGRRDDGKGLRIDLVEESVKVLSEPPFSLPVVEYLRSRGVAEALLPGPDGFAFPAARSVAVTVNVE
ncbi:MAG: hypothetical protein U0797_13175 [Gemmataceae bacterium]